MESIFDCFERDKKASRELLAKYHTILPSALLDVWQEYGFGSLLGGYLKRRFVKGEFHQAQRLP